MRKIALAAVLLGLAMPLSASADFYTGTSLKKLCAGKSPILLGYLAGWTDKWQRDTNMLAEGYEREKTPQGKRAALSQLQRTTEGICIPYGASLGQMLDILCKYVEANPAKAKLGATELLAQSVSEAWQCETEE
jgi:hypothetical protein